MVSPGPSKKGEFLVYLTSPLGERRAVKAKTHFQPLRAARGYGILWDRELVIEERGKTIKALEAQFLDGEKEVHVRLEVDITALVERGAKPEEVEINVMFANKRGVVVYLPPQYDRNVERWEEEERKRGNKGAKAKRRHEIVGRYKIWDWMVGDAKEEFRRLFFLTQQGKTFSKEINVPPSLFTLLECKSRDMTHMHYLYVFDPETGLFYFQAINNSRLSWKEWEVLYRMPTRIIYTHRKRVILPILHISLGRPSPRGGRRISLSLSAGRPLGAGLSTLPPSPSPHPRPSIEGKEKKRTFPPIGDKGRNSREGVALSYLSTVLPPSLPTSGGQERRIKGGVYLMKGKRVFLPSFPKSRESREREKRRGRKREALRARGKQQRGNKGEKKRSNERRKGKRKERSERQPLLRPKVNVLRRRRVAVRDVMIGLEEGKKKEGIERMDKTHVALGIDVPQAPPSRVVKERRDLLTAFPLFTAIEAERNSLPSRGIHLIEGPHLFQP